MAGTRGLLGLNVDRVAERRAGGFVDALAQRRVGVHGTS
jgi:hypothetical protein